MRRAFWIFLILPWVCGFGEERSALAADDACWVTQQSVIAPMPAYRDQGDKNLCYAFATVTALDQMLCKKGVSNCAKPDQRLSVLDLIRKGTDPGVFEFGSSVKLLATLQTLRFKEGKISLASEACAPYQRFLPSRPQEILESARSFSDLEVEYRRARRFLDGNDCPEFWNAASRLSVFSDGDLPVPEVAAAVQKLAFEEFMKTITVPGKCAASAMEVPLFSFSGRLFEKPMTRSSVRDWISTNVAAKRSTIWAFCPDLELKDVCQANYGHLVNIFGIRQRCCPSGFNPTCRTEYLVRDSAAVVGPLTGQGTGPGDFWVSEDFVLSRSESYERNPTSAAQIGGKKVHPSFTWLE